MLFSPFFPYRSFFISFCRMLVFFLSFFFLSVSFFLSCTLFPLLIGVDGYMWLGKMISLKKIHRVGAPNQIIPSLHLPFGRCLLPRLSPSHNSIGLNNIPKFIVFRLSKVFWERQELLLYLWRSGRTGATAACTCVLVEGQELLLYLCPGRRTGATTVLVA